MLVVVASATVVVAHAQSAQSTRTQYAVEQYEAGNEAAAIRFLIQLGYQGDIAAQFNLGIINLSREDDPNGKREALFWFKKAAEEGDVGAQFNLGMLQRSDNDPELARESLLWLDRAAEAGRIEAQTNLGILRFINAISESDENQARRWLDIAAEQEDPAAIEALSLLELPGNSAGLKRLLHPLDLMLRAETVRSDSEVLVDLANIYPLPSRGQAPLATLNKGALVEVIEKRNGWVKIGLKRGLPAWIQPAMVEVVGGKAIVRRLEAPLYAKPELGPEVVKLGTATKGESMLIQRFDADWLMVEAPNRFRGWMRESDIDIRVRTIVTAMNQNQRSDEVSGSEDTEQVYVIGARSERSGALTTAEFDQSLRALPVNPRDGIGLFTLTSRQEALAEPVEDAQRLGLVARGTNVFVERQRDGYSFSSTLPLVGWTFSGLIDVTYPVKAGERGAGIANRTGGRIRIEPAIGKTIVDRLTRGDEVSIMESRDGWLLIEASPQPGWIDTNALEIVVSSNIDQLVSTGEFTDVDGKASLVAPAETPQPGRNGNVQTNGDVNASSTMSLPADTVVYTTSTVTSPPLGRLTESVEIADPGLGSRERAEMLFLPRTDKLAGWIFGALVELEQGEGDPAAGTVSVNSARVRLDPTTGRDNIITSLRRGTAVQIVAREADWLRIQLPAAAGYASLER